MSEDRPQYAATMTPPDPPPTNAEIADMLRALSSDMMHLGSVMQYVGGFGPISRNQFSTSNKYCIYVSLWDIDSIQ